MPGRIEDAGKLFPLRIQRHVCVRKARTSARHVNDAQQELGLAVDGVVQVVVEGLAKRYEDANAEGSQNQRQEDDVPDCKTNPNGAERAHVTRWRSGESCSRRRAQSGSASPETDHRSSCAGS